MRKSTWIILAVILIVVIVVAIVLLVNRPESYYQTLSESPISKAVRFEVVAKDTDYNNYVYRELMTDFVYYGYLNDVGRNDGLTALYDPDTALPLKYDRYIELGKLVDR